MPLKQSFRKFPEKKACLQVKNEMSLVIEMLDVDLENCSLENVMILMRGCNCDYYSYSGVQSQLFRPQ